MRKHFIDGRFVYLTFLCIGLYLSSCDQQAGPSSKPDTTNAINSAREVVQEVFDYSNNLDFISGLQHYVDDSLARYTSNGRIYPSLSALKSDYEQVGPLVEVLNNEILSWHIVAYSEKLIAFNLPIRLTIKMKGSPAYTGELVWTGIVEKRGGKWRIAQSHESWLNCAEAMSALSVGS